MQSVSGDKQDFDQRLFFRASIYVRVIGELEQYNGRNYLNITNIRKIVDYHEFCFHILDAMIITLTYERGPPVSTREPCKLFRNVTALLF